MTPEKRLWQSVLFQAVRYATSTVDSNEKREADAWLRRGGKDFRKVCDLAGVDSSFVRGAYMSGKIDAELLRSAG